MVNSQDKVLIVGPSWVGDMVIAHSLIQIMTEGDRPARVSVLAPTLMAPLLARMPEVAETIVTPFIHGRLQLSARWRLARTIRQMGFGRAIILPGSLKAALIPFLAGIPQRTGFLGEKRYGFLNDIRSFNPQQTPLAVSRFVQLGLPAESPLKLDYPSPRLTSEPGRAAQVLQSIGFDVLDQPALVLCPGAEFGPAKRWPAQSFAAVAKSKVAEGWQVWVIGNSADQLIGEEIRGEVGPACFNLAGQTRLDQAIDLISAASCVVTNDSGLMHVAAALSRPLVAVFGSTSPALTPPLSADVEIVSLELDCSPCFKRSCPLQHTHCLTRLPPEQVLDAMTRLAAAPTTLAATDSPAPL